ncbi:MAG TPA: flagellar basal-body MS-ring/collar protein FliF [Burkholderiaceae bacterium]|jgi:flagellar M-ring protein FliF|nr:flagellar basal-body MS-ring/collar protein FliF [Burkholderiaceae bacterium]
MAVAGEAVAPPPAGITGFIQSPVGRNVLLSAGIAAAVGVIVAVWLWTQQPEYRVLFSNFSDRDGGAIVASLNQLNIPYKFAEGGGAILVPSNQVYDARLKLAAQGLPKGGNVGFEIMENQKLGVSQFLEQVNYQRALEGELASSIQSLAAVQAARVHLALPKASVFMRDQQKPTASVLLNLSPGRSLDEQQVSAIVHLVASSVPDLSAKNVTVVDQNGDLLSSADKMAGNNGLDPTQLKYVQELQRNIASRVESIIAPIVGANNVRAEATADVDFSHSEQAAETYKPNQPPNEAAVRSLQTSETTSASATNPSGVPGALTNQPPAPAVAPINATPAAAAGANATPGNTHKDNTVNYEVDKTIRYVQQPMGGLKRLSVAVVVNYKREIDKAGKVTHRPLTDDEKTQITNLVKEAMGYSKDRGDTLNVVNSSFAGPDAVEDVPFWKRPDTLWEMAKEGLKWLGILVFAMWVYFTFIKPMVRKLKKNLGPAVTEHKPAEDEEDTIVELSNEVEPMGNAARTYQDNLDAAKELARQDPKVVANIVKAWVGSANE